MTITFTCPHCGKTMNVADEYAGQSGPCSACGKQITIPYAPPGKPVASDSRFSGLIVVLIGAAIAIPVLLACTGILVALLLPAVHAAREAARRQQCVNNLKQIALAMHNYHDTYKTFPPAYLEDETGRPAHSWRVLILPFIASNPLYDQYDFSKPWDSPENQRIGQTAVHVYSCPSVSSSPTNTSYMVITDPDTVFPAVEAIGIQKISDGTSNTLLVVEVPGVSINWTDPTDVSKAELLRAIRNAKTNHPGGFNVALADGSVRFISTSIDPRTLEALLTRDGGEQVQAY